VPVRLDPLPAGPKFTFLPRSSSSERMSVFARMCSSAIGRRWADINVPFWVESEVFSREGPILLRARVIGWFCSEVAGRFLRAMEVNRWLPGQRPDLSAPLSLPGCPGLSPCSPSVRLTRCYASTNRRSNRQLIPLCSKIGLTESRGAGGTDQAAGCRHPSVPLEQRETALNRLKRFRCAGPAISASRCVSSS
jgi:hypothetical protein